MISSVIKTSTILFVLGALGLIFSNSVRSQNLDWQIKGKPRVIHYSKEDYNSDSQFWCMAQDDEGVLYFGNNDGVAIYDGEVWTLVKVPNGSTVRGLKYASDGYVYVGGYDELGRLSRNEYGKYEYESLLHLLRTEDQTFNDVWQIEESNGFVIFRSFKRLIAIKNKQAVTIPAEGRFDYLGIIEKQLFAVDGWGIKRLSLSSMEFDNLIPASGYNQEEVSALLPGTAPNKLMVFTREGNSYQADKLQGSITFQHSFFADGSSDQIFCAIASDTGSYFLGTINSMLMELRYQEDGQMEIHKYENLQDQTILNLYQTKDGNVWTLLNTGLDCVELSSPISKIFDDAAVYDATFYQGQFYLATNQGVYAANHSLEDPTLVHSDFKLVDRLEAQAWSMRIIEDQLLISHDKGVLVKNAKGIYHVEGTNGVWKVVPANGVQDMYLACSYDGIYVLKYQDGKFFFQNKLQGFDVSGRDILAGPDPYTYWVCHGYQGVYKIKTDAGHKRTLTLEKYTDQNGLPSPYSNNVFVWEEDTVFTTVSGVYTYQEDQNQFVPHPFLTQTLGDDVLIRKIQQHGDRTWFVKEEQLGYFYTRADDPELNMDLFLSLEGTFMKSMEYVQPLGSDQLLVGTNDGMFSFNLSMDEAYSPDSRTLISEIKYKDEQDSLIYCVLPTETQELTTLPNNTSSLQLSFITPTYSSQKDVQYRYKLEENDKTWSDWSTVPHKEYSYLKSGRYTFRVQSRTSVGQMADEAQFEFEILPLWYQTDWAKIVFASVAVLVIFLIRVLVRRKLIKTQEEAKKMQAALELEIENIKLEKEKALIEKDKKMLEEDVIFKSKELANYTILLLKKRELLTEMAAELKELKSKIKVAANREIVRSMTRRINLNLQDEEHLSVFDANFERVHQDFFRELKANYPNLSQKELRLCGFVRMNLTNKEIAAILNISVRGVETARYRLRKNLSLEKEVNMVEFLEKLSGSSEDQDLDQENEEYFNEE
ncbi:helix-turn-helix and ligand-binding sensor domain-containing protein [Reichenbachiella ulvae]|uniref:HTH luxR-type domain-containing protein n=1 Tax=Reichenbachiella ulvae TaxID=2980104 RepID=A0ABT3CPT4_9BACT|nr:triple tyrosine motif-containing protein [Reichenbachiella ulvae]MCV9385534.1 hypothetical protein [Reichenbachiella ulvae]